MSENTATNFYLVDWSKRKNKCNSEICFAILFQKDLIFKLIPFCFNFYLYLQSIWYSSHSNFNNFDKRWFQKSIFIFGNCFSLYRIIFVLATKYVLFVSECAETRIVLFFHCEKKRDAIKLGNFGHLEQIRALSLIVRNYLTS